MTTKTKMSILGVVIVVILFLGMYIYFNLPSVQQRISHAKSEAIGLNRTITLFDSSGKPVKSWKGRVQVELEGGAARFIVDRKTIIIAGTYIIEEN